MHTCKRGLRQQFFWSATLYRYFYRYYRNHQNIILFSNISEALLAIEDLWICFISNSKKKISTEKANNPPLPSPPHCLNSEHHLDKVWSRSVSCELQIKILRTKTAFHSTQNIHAWISLILVHSERPKLYILSAKELNLPHLFSTLILLK